MMSRCVRAERVTDKRWRLTGVSIIQSKGNLYGGSLTVPGFAATWSKKNTTVDLPPSTEVNSGSSRV